MSTVDNIVHRTVEEYVFRTVAPVVCASHSSRCFAFFNIWNVHGHRERS